MTDKVLVKQASGIRSLRTRDRSASIFIIEVDMKPFCEDVYKAAQEKYGPEHLWAGVKLFGARIGYVPTSAGFYVFNVEGCSLNADEKPVTETSGVDVPVYKTFEKAGGRQSFSIFPFADVTLSMERLLGLPVIGAVNFGEWVRKFGDRLESNFHNWNNHLTPIYDAEHVRTLIS